MRNQWTAMSAILFGLAVLAFSPVTGPAAEWEEDSPYYEDDAWYDISEWFDGNDYNPTDETFGEIDDERFDFSDNTGSDRDNDTWYGYNTVDRRDDWFYDYYDPGYYTYLDDEHDGLYEFGYRYYDYDNDGSYDAMVAYSDFDADGYYDNYDYYYFDESGQQQQKQKAKKQAPKDSARRTVNGTVKKTKEVQVRGNRHLLVTLDHNGEQIFADLGRVDELKNVDVNKGDRISVEGPMAGVGEKKLLFAKRLQANNQTKEINRNGREMKGKVVETRKSKVRGSEHLIAIVETEKKGHKTAVDLGPAKDLKIDVKKDAQLTFTGVPVRVQDRRLVLAQSVQKGDQSININRKSSDKQSQKRRKSSCLGRFHR